MSYPRERGVKVSVLMPTYRQVDYIARAINSLLGQTLDDWELLVLDDGSPDSTGDIVRSYTDPRIRYFRFPENRGLGEALNWLTKQASGELVSYLPSDDCLDSGHLADCVALLDENAEIYAAYAGLRWWNTTSVDSPVRSGDSPFRKRMEMPTLHGSGPVGMERETLLGDTPPADNDLLNGNVFALVQVVHRRSLEAQVRWTPRHEGVSDRIELEYWRRLARRGARFGYTGHITCEWSDHPDQRHKIIAGRRFIHATDPTGRGYGLSRYRQYYGVPPTELIKWYPGRAVRDERILWDRMTASAAGRSGRGRPAGHERLKILIVGEPGHNPERLLALAEHGHELYGLWTPSPHVWMTAHSTPFTAVPGIPFDGRWKDRVNEIAPDVIYAVQNWRSLAAISEVFESGIGIPLVLHFKESPHLAMEMGYWPHLRRLLAESAGVILINDESRDWFEAATGLDLHTDRVRILDGDMPSARWATDDWAPKLSAQDGEIHTVSVGRVKVEDRIILDPVPELAKRGIHVHVYGDSVRWRATEWVAAGADSRYLHLHGNVERHDWVRELSRYDAAWTHAHVSGNDGEILRAHWDDLNLPARIGTFAVAGLPWIVRDNPGHRVAVQSLAAAHRIGVEFHDLDDLAEKLRDSGEMGALTERMRSRRSAFCFDHHVSALTDFFRQVIDR